MRSSRIHCPGAAMVVAVLALFVALSGTAVAAGVVPLAKRALVADNAKKLGGKTAAQVAAAPGPASTGAGLVSIVTGTFSLPAGTPTTSSYDQFAVPCPAGQKALAGGYASEQSVQGADESISPDGGTWSVLIWNLEAGTATGSTYAVCLR